MRSPLFIHSFPRGQVLSLWWMGAGTSQLFSLDGTSLTRSELKRPPCQRSPGIPVLFRGPHSAAIVLTRTQTPAPPPDIPGAFYIRIYLRNWGCWLQFRLHGSECFMPGGDYGVSSSFSGEWWGRNHGGCVEAVWWGLGTVAAVLVALLTATRELVSQLVCISEALVKVRNVYILSAF